MSLQEEVALIQARKELYEKLEKEVKNKTDRELLETIYLSIKKIQIYGKLG